MPKYNTKNNDIFELIADNDNLSLAKSISYSWFNMFTKISYIVVAVVLLSSCSSSIRFTTGNSGGTGSSKSSNTTNSNKNNSVAVTKQDKVGSASVGEIETGVASYYGDAFHGRTTASGTIYDQYQLTAAHRTLPFGTMVMVYNQNNGKTVVVEITDRGPFKDGRIIDLSTAAAETIDMINDGIVPVEVKVISKK